MTLDASNHSLMQISKVVARGARLQPELVPADKIIALNRYKRFNKMEEKRIFRNALLSALISEWESAFGHSASLRIKNEFLKIDKLIDDNGAIILSDLICPDNFGDLVACYTDAMKEYGSISLLHSYIDFRACPQFLCNTKINRAFLHPLLIALIAYRIGGPIRVVDARGKDALPLIARAQDNMLHIDNTPFNDEYKVIVTWEKGTACGPRGQNFVFLPGTQVGARNCFINGNNEAWSTENCSIFIDEQSVDMLFKFQRLMHGSQHQTVIEVCDPRPLTTVFAAGSLAHHRYRTNTGSSRSCIIIAFHSAIDNSGNFFHTLGSYGDRDLEQILFHKQHTAGSCDFLESIKLHAPTIGAKIMEISELRAKTKILEIGHYALPNSKIPSWIQNVTSAPEIEDIKKSRKAYPFGKELTRDQLLDVIGPTMMLYDKHGPLDLILYEDGREEKRKIARNRIREMRIDRMTMRLKMWKRELISPTVADIMFPADIIDMCSNMLRHIDMHKISFSRVSYGDSFCDHSNIPRDIAITSTAQLITDLSEAIGRCYSLQNFLSTSLFIFWCCDEMKLLLDDQDEMITVFGGRLLRHYIAVAVLDYQIDRGV